MAHTLLSTAGSDYEFEEFVDDEQTVDAVFRNYEVIGEAAKYVPAEFRRTLSDVPRSEVAGMRDKLIHGCATVDLRIVWATVQEEVPELTNRIETVRTEHEEKR